MEILIPYKRTKIMILVTNKTLFSRQIKIDQIKQINYKYT